MVNRFAFVVVVAALAVFSLTATGGEPAPSPSLVPNGDFEVDANADKWPDGWGKPAGASWEQEGDRHFLRLHPEQPGQSIVVFRSIPLPANVQSLELGYEVRYTNIKPGKQAWFDGRIILKFKDAANKDLKPEPKHPNFRGSSKGWEQRGQTLAVPAGAKSMDMMLAMFEAASGTLDLDQITLRATGGAPGATATAGDDSAKLAPAPPPDASVRPAMLRVAGNQIQAADGKAVWLQGVNVPSLEWSVAGENVAKSVQVAIDDWKANLIRLPVREDYWFGRGEHQKDGGTSYRDAVDLAIANASGRKAYVVLDLHRFLAPTDAAVEFWKDAATRYKDHPAVLFGLFNEPHGISWEIWRNGGEVQKKKKGDEDAFGAGQATNTTLKTVGMQRLVETVRETGAKNIVVAGGLDYAYDLSGIASGFALEDKAGNGIVYDTHIYPWKRKWQEKVLAIAEKHPVLVGETGAEVKRLSFIPASAQEDPYTWVPDLLGLIQKHKLHWTAWSFHMKAAPKMLTDWEYTPTPYWGAFVRAALRGARFEMNRMR